MNDVNGLIEVIAEKTFANTSVLVTTRDSFTLILHIVDEYGKDYSNV